MQTSNFEHAREFVEKLTGSADTPVTFQIIPEIKGCKAKPGILHGTITDLWPDLQRANQQGACVSIAVNETDGKGRREENMVRMRALFVDWDGGTTPVTFETLSAKLPPTMTVQSKRGQHNYWVLTPVAAVSAEDRARGMVAGDDIGSFRMYQRDLARALATDPAVADPAKAMRLPGLLHQKNPQEPFLVQLAQATDVTYTAAEVSAAFPAPPEVKPTSDIDEDEAERRLKATSPEDRYKQARYFIEEHARHAVSGSGGRNITLGVLWDLFAYGLDEAQILELAELYNNTKCDPAWSERDITQMLRDGESKRVPGSRLWETLSQKRTRTATAGPKVTGLKKPTFHVGGKPAEPETEPDPELPPYVDPKTVPYNATVQMLAMHVYEAVRYFAKLMAPDNVEEVFQKAMSLGRFSVTRLPDGSYSL
jgi:hypothetical protein